MGWNINASSRKEDMSVSDSRTGRTETLHGERKNNEETPVDTGTEDGEQTVTKLGNQGVNE